jgi:hypothetical protein
VVPAKVKAPVCDIARAALHDLPAVMLPSIAGMRRSPERFYNGRRDKYHRDALLACPQLAHYLPPGFPLASDAVFRRLQVNESPKPVVIVDVEVPVIDASGKRATVAMGYNCNGLCAARFLAIYVLTSSGWTLQGRPEITSVS